MDDDRINYKKIIDALPDAFAYHRVITDDHGDAVDYEYIDVNQAFLEMTGLAREKVIGSRGSDLHKNYKETYFDWLEIFGQVAKTGESICFERHFEAAGKYCKISIFSNDPGSFAIIYRGISARDDREKALLECEKSSRTKLAAIMSPNGKIEKLSLGELINVEELQGMLSYFYELAGIGVAIVDNYGNILIKTGWQDICKKFHRVNPLTRANCVESDLELSNGVDYGELKSYKCKNNMWDIATPIIIGTKKMGNLFFGQFFYEDEIVDYDLFRNQARTYGFNEEKYIEALAKVPRFSREKIGIAMKFYTQLVNMISMLTYSNIEQARLVVERDQNIRNLKQTEKDLSREAGLRVALLDNIPGCIALILKKDTREIVASNRMAHETGALPGLTCYQTCAERDDPCPFCQAPKMWETGEVQRLEVEYRGTWYEGIWAPLSEDHYVHYIFDISDRKKVDNKIRFLSYHDQLTGLYNRHYLELEMKRFDTERQLPISMIMADINNLKLVNDTFGHAKGDEMLKKAAAIITDSCRSEDIIARWGGDEFLVYLPRTKKDKAIEISRRIEENFNKVKVAGIPLSVSLGVETKQDMDMGLNSIFKKAEDKMYDDKLKYKQTKKSFLLKTLQQNLAEKSFESEEHLSTMQTMAGKVAEKLSLSEEDRVKLMLLINLHDIGKITISKEILQKSGPLSSEEWEVIKRHPEDGYRIARAIDSFAHIAEEILAHHEKWDGSGYPHGLKGKKTPLLARIVAAADAYEVMSSGRPYKKAMTRNEIAAEFEKESGKHFDPEIAEAVRDYLAGGNGPGGHPGGQHPGGQVLQ